MVVTVVAQTPRAGEPIGIRVRAHNADRSGRTVPRFAVLDHFSEVVYRLTGIPRLTVFGDDGEKCYETSPSLVSVTLSVDDRSSPPRHADCMKPAAGSGVCPISLHARDENPHMWPSHELPTQVSDRQLDPRPAARPRQHASHVAFHRPL